MEILYRCCAGLDVHKKVIVACVLKSDKQKPICEIRTFGTSWQELHELERWLVEMGCTHVAMESTGVYWRPVFNVLEESFEQVMIVNAQHIKAVPGRKTDVKDAQWIAQLLQHGLLRPSFIPPRPQRELRELTRGRKQLTEERARVVNRLQKVLEDTNIKLASVVSDITGQSALQMLDALLQGQKTVQQIAQMAKGKLREKIPELEDALQGDLREHHRFLLHQYLKHLRDLEQDIAAYDQEIERRLKEPPDPSSACTPSQPSPEQAREPEEAWVQEPTEPQQENQQPERIESFGQVVERWKQVTGIGQRGAEILVAEIGTDMSRFASAAHLASWVGVCPGNRISAGKRLGGKTTKGNRYVRDVLVQAAQAAARSKGTFLGAYFRRLKPRLGYKRAIIALAHRILVILYNLCKDQQPYQEKGEQAVEERLQEARKQQALRQLRQLGYQVSLQQTECA